MAAKMPNNFCCFQVVHISNIETAVLDFFIVLCKVMPFNPFCFIYNISSLLLLLIGLFLVVVDLQAIAIEIFGALCGSHK